MWNNPRALDIATAAMLALAFVLVAAASLVWLSQLPMFTLKSIRLESTAGHLQHVNVATVRAAALPRLLNKTHGNFFGIDLELVRTAFESVAWVRRAQVRREWPDLLVVRIEEHQVLGTWDEGRLISRSGELFTANLDEAEEEGKLPALSGPPGSEKDVAQRFHDFTGWFARIGMKPAGVTLSERYAWTVHLDDGSPAGLTVELGRERDARTLIERVDRLTAAYPLVAAKWPKLRLVDLRYPNGFALRAEGVRVISDEASRPRAPARLAQTKGASKPTPTKTVPRSPSEQTRT